MRKGKRKKLLSFALALSMVVTGTNVPMKQASAEEMQDGTVAEEGYASSAPDEWYRHRHRMMNMLHQSRMSGGIRHQHRIKTINWWMKRTVIRHI